MNSSHLQVMNQLKTSEEPSIRYSVAVSLDHENPNSSKMRELQEEIRNSARVQSLLSHVEGVYNKWQGSHWVLSLLAELNYPFGDDSLLPLREQVYNWLLSPKFIKSIKTINGKVRRCASQEGNAIYYSYKLGLVDERTEQLVDRLLEFQWSDGGWNCDKNPTAHCSSYHESLIPLRALIRCLNDAGKQMSKDRSNVIQIAVENAKEVFLKRELYLSASTGKIIHPNFALLHFPYYWRYNILFALKVMNEGGFLSDPRCQQALRYIQSKELPTGGFPAEIKYYTFSTIARSGRSVVNWGGTNKKKFNDWITSEVFSILKAANRL
jgi:hypothetical protein